MRSPRGVDISSELAELARSRMREVRAEKGTPLMQDALVSVAHRIRHGLDPPRTRTRDQRTVANGRFRSMPSLPWKNSIHRAEETEGTLENRLSVGAR